MFIKTPPRTENYFAYCRAGDHTESGTQWQILHGAVVLGGVLGGQGGVLGVGAAAAAADADGERADAEVAAHLQHHARAVVEVGERHHRCGENYTCNNVMMTERQYVTLVKAKKLQLVVQLHGIFEMLHRLPSNYCPCFLILWM